MAARSADVTPAERPEEPRIALPPALFAAAFPFHVAAGPALDIVQVGAALQRVCPALRPGARLADQLRLVQPPGTLDRDWILAHRDRFCLLAVAGADLRLRGHFVEVPADGTLLFLGSPWFTSAAEIAAHGLRFDDFALHDAAVDLLQVFQASKQALADAKKLAAKLTAQRGELRALNERLREREAEARQLSLVAARTDNAVILADASGRVLWVNEGFTRITGYRPDEILGRTPGSLLQGPGTDPDTVQRIRDRLRRGEGFTEELLNYRRDGRPYWIAVEVQPLHDPSGQMTGFMAVESDVTERRSAQQRLAIQFEVSSALADADDETTAMNQVLGVLGQRLGWPVGQFWRVDGEHMRWCCAWHVDGAPVDDFIAESRRFDFRPGLGLIGSVWSQGLPVWIRDVTTDDGFLRAAVAARAGLRSALAFPIMVRGEIQGVVEFLSRQVEWHDDDLLQTLAAVGRQFGQFIARRESERALRASDERFRLALEGADLGAWDLRLPGGESLLNDRYYTMLGYAPGEVDASYARWSDLLHPDDAARATAAFDAHLRGETEVYESEHRMRHKSGAWIWVQDRGRVIDRDASGRPTRVCGTHLDVTERKRVEAELRREKELLDDLRRREIDTGQQIQRSLLIGDLPHGTRGVDIAGYAAPSQGVDGDFFAFTRFRPDCLELLVGDVMGKGIPAALVGAGVRSAYNQVNTELLAAALGSGELPRPADIVDALHRRLTPQLMRLDTFVTLALYRFEPDSGRMTFVNAGHTAGLIRRRDGAVAAVLGDNLPIGTLPEERYVETEAHLDEGEALLVYSDGLTEARDGAGAQFGEERLRRFLGSVGGLDLPASVCLQALRKAVRDFAASDGIQDDQTAVLVTRLPAAADRVPAPGAAAAREQFDLPWRLSALEPLRLRVTEAAQPLGSDAAGRLVLAAFEVATNVVRHVPQPFPGARISCRILPAPDRVTVELFHIGAPFVPPQEVTADLSGRREGGFGLYIIQRAVSEVAYDTPFAGVCRTTLTQRAGERGRA